MVHRSNFRLVYAALALLVLGGPVVFSGSNRASAASYTTLCTTSFNIYLYDSGGHPVDSTASCIYDQGHIYSLANVDMGVVPVEAEGWIYNSSSTIIGYIVPQAPPHP